MQDRACSFLFTVKNHDHTVVFFGEVEVGAGGGWEGRVFHILHLWFW